MAVRLIQFAWLASACAALSVLGSCSKRTQSADTTAAGSGHSAVRVVTTTRATTQVDVPVGQSTDERWIRVADIDSLQSYSPNNGNRSALAFIPINLNAMAFISEQKLLVADGKYGVRIFDSDTGKLLRQFGDPLSDVHKGESRRQVFFSPDGRLAMVLPDAAPKIWRTDTGECVATLPRFADRYMVAAFYPDDIRLVTLRGETYSRDPSHNLQLWQLGDGAVALRAAAGANFQSSSLIRCPPYLLAVGYGGEVFDLETLRRLPYPWPKRISHFMWAEPQTGTLPARIGTLQLSDGKAIGDPRRPATIDVTSLSDGHILDSWICRLSELEKDQNDHRFQRFYAISPDHRVLAVSRSDRVDFFELDGWKCLWTLHEQSSRGITEVKFLSSFRVAMNRPTGLQIYDYRSGRLLGQIPGIYVDPYQAYSPSGNRLALREVLISGKEFLPDRIILLKNSMADGEAEKP